MTRLTSGDIEGLASRLEQFDAELERKTGETLLGISCHGIGADVHMISNRVSDMTLAVIPFTCGMGTIDTFSQTLKQIAGHLGFLSCVTHATDAAGVAEACERSADIIMMADDSRYVAIHLKQMKSVDNGWATGNAFASALDLMGSGLKNKTALVTGCGPVGQAAVKKLMEFGARVAVYDPDVEKSMKLSKEVLKQYKKKLKIEGSVKNCGETYHYIVEASTAADIIDVDQITRDTYVAAPGVPLGITRAAVEKLKDRLIYDPLALGTATMAIEAAMSGYQG